MDTLNFRFRFSESQAIQFESSRKDVGISQVAKNMPSHRLLSANVTLCLTAFHIRQFFSRQKRDYPQTHLL
jgi:hypothetical protein